MYRVEFGIYALISATLLTSLQTFFSVVREERSINLSNNRAKRATNINIIAPHENMIPSLTRRNILTSTDVSSSEDDFEEIKDEEDQERSVSKVGDKFVFYPERHHKYVMDKYGDEDTGDYHDMMTEQDLDKHLYKKFKSPNNEELECYDHQFSCRPFSYSIFLIFAILSVLLAIVAFVFRILGFHKKGSHRFELVGRSLELSDVQREILNRDLYFDFVNDSKHLTEYYRKASNRMEMLRNMRQGCRLSYQFTTKQQINSSSSTNRKNSEEEIPLLQDSSSDENESKQPSQTRKSSGPYPSVQSSDVTDTIIYMQDD